MATNNQLNLNLSGQTGTGSIVGSTSPTLTTPVMTQVNDANGNIQWLWLSNASAVNYIRATNSGTGVQCSIAAIGGDSNVLLNVVGAGTSGVRVQGNTSGSGNAAAGYYGEIMSTVVASGSAVTFTSTSITDLASISLTSGDWFVWANIYYTGTTITSARAWINTTSAAAPDTSVISIVQPVATSTTCGFAVPSRRILGVTPTVYLSGSVTGTGTLTAAGGIYAIRSR